MIKYFANKVAIILILLIFVISGKTAHSQATEEALTLDVVKSILAQDEESIELTKSLIDISNKAHIDFMGKGFDINQVDQQLATMAQELSTRLNNPRDNSTIIDRINQYIFEEQKFRVDRSKLFESTLDSMLINRVLEDKKGQCLSLSLVYLCLAEKLNLPLYGVMVPNHFFVKYVDGDKTINIETTDHGKHYNNTYYVQVYLRGYNDKSPEKTLSKKETIAIYLSNLANHYKLKGDHIKAMEMFKTIIEVIPDRASLYTNLGNTYERDKQIVAALVQYQKALELNPYLCEAHHNAGLAHMLYTKRYQDARKHGKITQKLGCRIHPAFQSFLSN